MPNEPGPDASETPEQRARRIAERRKAARASAMGIQFAVSIGIGAWAGSWLDGKFDTGPTLLIVGVLLGATAAFRDLYALARKSVDEE